MDSLRLVFGSSIFRKEWLEAGKFGEIRDRIKALISAAGFKEITEKVCFCHSERSEESSFPKTI